jgi:hypothetical protein
MWIVFFNIVLNHRLKKLVEEPKEGNAWHADHIIPVYKGGGMHTHFLCFFFGSSVHLLIHLVSGRRMYA